MARMNKEKALGQIFNNKYGKYEVIGYESASKVKVRWQDYPCEVWCQWHDAVRGNVKNPMFPSILGVACFGIGPHVAYLKGTNKTVKSYSCWKAMLQRCYDEKFRNKWQSYAEVVVCEEWLNYQNFATWYTANYIEGWQLDKDIKSKGNKIYSPNTCMFVPKDINRLFISNKSERGEWPIGVNMRKKVTPRYIAHCNNEFNRQVKLGTYDSPEEAFYAYKVFKEEVIKKTAEKFKGQISDYLYSLLISYRVEQGD